MSMVGLSGRRIATPEGFTMALGVPFPRGSLTREPIPVVLLTAIEKASTYHSIPSFTSPSSPSSTLSSFPTSLS